MPKKYKCLAEARDHNCIVNAGMRAGLPLEAIVVALANENKRQLDRIVELELLCPRKYKCGSNVLVWHCPNELVPFDKNIIDFQNKTGDEG